MILFKTIQNYIKNTGNGYPGLVDDDFFIDVSVKGVDFKHVKT
jgi:hypothetical protein